MNFLNRLEFGPSRLPSILQTEAAECSLACLAMIAGYHRFRTDLPTLRARFSLSLKGANLVQIMRYADGLHLASRPLRLEVEEMRQLKTPCILHWNLSHFVVLKKADEKGIVIHDPAIGVRRLPYAEVATQFTGVALELTPNIEFKAADEKRKISIRGLLGKVDGLRRSPCPASCQASTSDLRCHNLNSQARPRAVPKCNRFCEAAYKLPSLHSERPCGVTLTTPHGGSKPFHLGWPT